MSGTGACPLEDEEFVEGEPEVVGDVDVASALTDIARALVGKKGEVPEAFKKQWKNKDKDGDGKENEPKPDFLKKIEKDKKDKKSSVGEELLRLARGLVGEDDEDEADDPKFVEKVKSLRGALTKLKSKRAKRLSTFGIAVIKPSSTVEDLVDALVKAAAS